MTPPETGQTGHGSARLSAVGQREIRTQERVIAFLRDALGYSYLGHWKDRENNSNIDEERLEGWLRRRGHDERIISRALFELNKAAALGGSKTLYDANRDVYGLLRYGVKVRPEVGEQTVMVWLIDWETPEDNDFAVAEEVTVFGVHAKRPDLVLYVNGIALGVLELKRSIVSVGEGIRQSLDSQKKKFIRPFYTTVQLVMAGNDTEGLRYAVIETPEKYWLRRKEADPHPAAGDNPLLREMGQMCRKERLLEIVHDFMVFEAGIASPSSLVWAGYDAIGRPSWNRIGSRSGKCSAARATTSWAAALPSSRASSHAHQPRSKRSRFITVSHAATTSRTNLSSESAHAWSESADDPVVLAAPPRTHV
jgi:hypothetical protein